MNPLNEMNDGRFLPGLVRERRIHRIANRSEFSPLMVKR